MKRELPTYVIEGTEFIVDVSKLELREKSNPLNTISFSDMRDFGDRYQLYYNLQNKNLPLTSGDESQSINISVPPLVKLDPVGMAVKYGNGKQSIEGKTDFDLIVDQHALQQRLNGRLPTIDIAGQTFFVDIRMDKLRPKDDFISNGISFSDIDHYHDDEHQVYIFPYNPKTHEFQEVDSEAITAIPKDLMVIEIPSEHILDPVGMNRRAGSDETNNLKFTGLKTHFEAKVSDWKTFGIDAVIKENLSNAEHYQKNNAARRRGRGKGRGL